MKQSTKIFEKKFIRLRNAIERKGIALIKRALKQQYKQFLERAKQTDFRQWPQLPETISEAPIKQFFEQYYQMSAKLAVISRNNLVNMKAEEEDAIYESIFANKLKSLVAESGQKISTITNTSKDRILKVIQNVLSEGETEGYGIDKMTSQLYREVGKELRGNGFARARAIAQTEIISASNQASQMAVESTGLKYKKYWSTSGLPGIRPSHLDAEQYSAENNGIEPNAVFPNGLLYPGDPAGPPEEVINCRCTILHEVY